MASDSGSKRVVYAALIGNLLVTVTKFVAAVWTGSVSMLSEAVHSLIDSSNSLLLLYGMRRSTLGPDKRHPLGYGREIYFWSFIVALMIFALGAGVSVYQGVRHIIEPSAIESPFVNYVVLGLAFLFESGSWWISLREFRSQKGDLSYWEATRRSKDPPSFMVLFEDSAALIGIVIALVGIAAADYLDAPRLDGLASVLIGLLLGGVAAILARESKGLLIGERADPELVKSIMTCAGQDAGIANANGIFTMHLAPDQIAVAFSLEFADELTTPQIEEKVVALEERVRKTHPEVIAIFIKPQTQRRWREREQIQFGG